MAETKINGVEYRVEHPPITQSWDLLNRMLLIGGAGAQHLPVLAQGAMKQAEDKTDSFLFNSASLHASAAMIRDVGSQELIKFKSDIISLARIKAPSGEYREIVLEADFIGDLLGIEELFNYIIKVIFSDFSKGSAANGQIGLALKLVKAIYQTKS